MKDFLIRIIASCFCLGYIPFAPGTFGTLAGSVLFYFLRHHTTGWFVLFVLVFAVAAIIVSHLAEKAFKQKDCQRIVIDEVAGVLCCYALVPYSPLNLVLGFILFRIFDIAKLPPARQAQDRLYGGLGVVMDDLVAGLQAGLILLFLPMLIKWAEAALIWLERTMG
ncbi:MAG: phosphatidylglycerophosphatase A [Deltaproteobacteria bacterium]|nr:phosphatidylglycerophosphatase A [Deltaproteobacteria bacterium]